jgi:hypothetical protein
MEDVRAALAASQGASEASTFSLFGSRVGRTLRGVVDRIRAFTELRVQEDLATATMLFYRRLQVWFEERQRDLAQARTRVAELAGMLDSHGLLPDATPAPQSADDDAEAMRTTLHASNTIRVVLPHGEDRLDRSAAEMLGLLPPEERERLELVLTRLVIEPRGGLAGACRGSADLGRQLAAPLIEQATAFLTNLLPGEDVTEVELSAADSASGEDLPQRVAGYLRAATPMVGGPHEEERTFVTLPDSAAGQRYADEVKQALPAAAVIPVRGPGTDLMFCREQGCLRTADLFRLLEPCWEAYHQAAANVESNPHSRFDVAAWLPLVE